MITDYINSCCATFLCHWEAIRDADGRAFRKIKFLLHVNKYPQKVPTVLAAFGPGLRASEHIWKTCCWQLRQTQHIDIDSVLSPNMISLQKTRYGKRYSALQEENGYVIFHRSPCHCGWLRFIFSIKFVSRHNRRGETSCRKCLCTAKETWVNHHNGRPLLADENL